MTQYHRVYTSYHIVTWGDCFVTCLLLTYGCAERHSQTSIADSSILDCGIVVFHCILPVTANNNCDKFETNVEKNVTGRVPPVMHN
jgi:hypothetical protein